MPLWAYPVLPSSVVVIRRQPPLYYTAGSQTSLQTTGQLTIQSPPASNPGDTVSNNCQKKAAKNTKWPPGLSRPLVFFPLLSHLRSYYRTCLCIRGDKIPGSESCAPCTPDSFHNSLFDSAARERHKKNKKGGKKRKKRKDSADLSLSVGQHQPRER